MRQRLRSSVLRTSVLLLTTLVLGSCSRSESDQTSGGGGPVRVGQQAPMFTLPSAAGGQVSLSEFTGKKPALLFFSMGPG
jgi:hypothetical protein